MAESKAPEDPYTLSFETTVESGGREVTLSETYFYPEGGGQPADRGTIGGVRVEDVRGTEEGVVHSLAEPLDAERGGTVTGHVDRTFRTYCMRAHTASHVLYGAGRRLFDDLGYGGFGITDEKVRVDLTTEDDVDDEALVELERLTNRAVWESRDVSWETVPREEALSREAVAFNTKTEEGVSGYDSVRIVTVEDWDIAACGGTHVRNTHEIGPVTVLERSNPGEGRTRVEFAVGPEGIERHAADRRAAMAAARELETSVQGLPDAVQRLQATREELESTVSDLQDELVAAEVGRLREETVERDGHTWLVGSLDGLDANELAEQVRTLSGEAADVVALVSPDGTLAVGTNGEVDAGDVVDDVTAEFGGGGGGSPTVAQGGGIDADAEAVVRFLRGE
ncbi:MAG: DHHA1 domain-containing protein [Haloarculaceae archaeon]